MTMQFSSKSKLRHNFGFKLFLKPKIKLKLGLKLELIWTIQF